MLTPQLGQDIKKRSTKDGAGGNSSMPPPPPPGPKRSASLDERPKTQVF